MASPRVDNGQEEEDKQQEHQRNDDTTFVTPIHANLGQYDSQLEVMGQQPLQQFTIQPPSQQSESAGSTTLAVTNLPYRIRWQDLKDLFRRYGTPSRADVFLAPDGRSRGVGMVSMRTRREAENCVNDLNGYEWFGRKIGVKIDETGGHHALAAAAMAGATVWEGVGFPSTTEYEAISPQLQPYANTTTTSPGTAGNPQSQTNLYLTQSASPMLFVGNDLKDLLRPAGRILRADIALAPDGRSKGWGTAVFATPQEAQNAIDTFDGWEVDGRIIKVRWDKFQGTTSESPQMISAGLSSPQMMHANLSPAQTPRPTEYMTVTTNPQQWQSQFMPTLRPMSLQSITGQPSPGMSTAMTMGTTPHSQFPQAYPQFISGPTSPTTTSQNITSQYPGVLYNPQSGWYQTNYNPSIPPSMQPQVRLPLSPSEPYNVGMSQQTPQQQGPTPQRRNESHEVYGFP